MFNKNYYSLLLCALIILGIASCDKYDRYNNTNNIKTPFSMVVGGMNGGVYSTNDGKVLDVYGFTFGDGSLVNDILIVDTNTLILKRRLHLFRNLPKGDYRQPLLNKEQPDGYNKMVYDKTLTFPGIWFCGNDGLYISIDNGETWAKNTTAFDVVDINNNTISPLIALKNKPTSIFTTEDNSIYCLQDTFLFKKASGNNAFRYVPANPNKGLSDTVTWWVVSGFQNTLVAFDTTGEVPMKYSNNGGVDWETYTGLPKDKVILFAKAPKDNPGRLYCGTDSAGLYELVGTNFVQFPALPKTGTKYYDIASKSNTYMSGIQRYYYYLATSDGIYESENSGTDWRLKNNNNGFSALW